MAERAGRPVDRTGADLDGRVAIDWGVYGIPETFVIDSDGTIAQKHIGPFTQAIMDDTIVQLIRSPSPWRTGLPKAPARQP